MNPKSTTSKFELQTTELVKDKPDKKIRKNAEGFKRKLQKN